MAGRRALVVTVDCGHTEERSAASRDESGLFHTDFFGVSTCPLTTASDGRDVVEALVVDGRDSLTFKWPDVRGTRDPADMPTNVGGTSNFKGLFP